MAAVFAPIQKFMSVTAVDTVLTFTKKMGYLALLNTGADPVWITLDGSVAVAADANGRTRIPSNVAIELTKINFLEIHAIALVAGPTGLQIIVMESPQ